jgi:hypothetical protein
LVNGLGGIRDISATRWISTLHTLGRSVLALHGHQHYATARMLEGMSEGHGDVLLVSAASAGTAQRWHEYSGASDIARLWPSFNVIELEGDALAIDTLSYAWKDESSDKRARRALVRAPRKGSQWVVQPLEQVRIEDEGPRLLLNAARCQLYESSTHPGRWDYTCEREVQNAPDVRLPRYVEAVEGLSDGEGVVNGRGMPTALPLQVHLELGGTTHYRVLGGVHRTLAEAKRVHGDRFTPFAYVALLNRYYSENARLTVRGFGDAAVDAFASATELGTGLGNPVPIQRGAEPGEIHVSVERCAPRTLLRVYWRLERA